jgi:dihydroorotate dehydrogenase (NAD+) catalytic subunit
MYNPQLSYEENLTRGPSADWDVSGHFPILTFTGEPKYSFLGEALHLPLGIPAGPLLSSEFVSVALQAGFCMPVYKTVRSSEWNSHPWPNILDVVDFKTNVGTAHASAIVVPLQKLPLREALNGKGVSITNAFGVPSRSPTVWHEDFLKLPSDAFNAGHHAVLSFQGSRREGEPWRCFLDDTQHCAQLAASTVASAGGRIVEMNVSCPNEAGAPIYTDFVALEETLKAASEGLADAKGIKLIVKLGLLEADRVHDVVELVAKYAHGISAINTLSAQISTPQGEIALGSGAAHGGICGSVIRSAALRMVSVLAQARQNLGLRSAEFGLVGVGGCSSSEHLKAFLDAGADVVHSATGAMWNLRLASECATKLGVSYQIRSAN